MIPAVGHSDFLAMFEEDLDNLREMSGARRTRHPERLVELIPELSRGGETRHRGAAGARGRAGRGAFGGG